MKYFYNRYVVFAAMTAFTLACSKEQSVEPAVTPPGTAFEISVLDGGYYPGASAETGPATRTVERGFTTRFTAGDRAGLYVIAADGSVQEANVEVTAVDGTGGELQWNLPAGKTIYHVEGMRYFLYYPYQMDMSGKVTGTSVADDATAGTFFAPLIESWQPEKEQSGENYTRSDLMVGQATVGPVTAHVVPLDFEMEHCMALVLVDMPGEFYHITSYNSGATSCDIYYSTQPEATFSEGTGLFKTENEPYYRYIVRPEEAFRISGQYQDEGGRTWEFSVPQAEETSKTSQIAAGRYMRHRVAGGAAERTGDYHTDLKLVRIGDMFCPDAENKDWYLVPYDVKQIAATDKVVGLVTINDPARIGTGEKTLLGEENVHGCVMAVKTASQTNMNWANMIKEENLGDHMTKADCYEGINGYDNCQTIKNIYGSFSQHPAFAAADNYNTECPLPEGKTTGWYLPAVGQIWSILYDLGEAPALGERSEQTSAATGMGGDNQDFIWYNQNQIMEKLNAKMALIPANMKTPFESTGYYWTSSQRDNQNARYWNVGTNGYLLCGYRYKMGSPGWGQTYYVRPVFVF